MVRSLSDLCLRCIGRNLSRLSAWQLKTYLSFTQKEILLQRMASHGLLTADVLPSVTYFLFSSMVRKVSFCACDEITDHLLGLLGQGCPNMASISLDACPNVSDKGLSGLFKPQKKLIELELRSMPKAVTGSAFAELKVPDSLKVVVLTASKMITEDGVRALVRNNPGIQHLSLADLALCTTNSAMEYIATQLSDNLNTLNLSRTCTVEAPGLMALAKHCPNLEKLLVNTNNRLTGEGLKEVLEHCSLRGLDISCCFKIEYPHFRAMMEMEEKCARLEHLHLPLHLAHIDLLSSLPRLTGVRELDLSGSDLPNEGLEKVCAALGGQLTKLLLNVCRTLTDAGCRSIATHCTELTALSMSINPNLKFTGLVPLFSKQKTADKLVRLDFGGCLELDQSVVSAIATTCRNLEMLDVAGCGDVDDNILQCLSETSPKLHFLSIKRCSKVTDDGLLHIIHNCPLRVLVASGCRNLTDRSMIPMAEDCHLLEEVYLSGNTGITPAAAAYIEDMGLCRVYVKHRVPNAPADLLMAKNLDTGRYEKMSG